MADGFEIDPESSVPYFVNVSVDDSAHSVARIGEGAADLVFWCCMIMSVGLQPYYSAVKVGPFVRRPRLLPAPPSIDT